MSREERACVTKGTLVPATPSRARLPVPLALNRPHVPLGANCRPRGPEPSEAASGITLPRARQAVTAVGGSWAQTVDTPALHLARGPEGPKSGSGDKGTGLDIMGQAGRSPPPSGMDRAQVPI